MLPQTRGSEKKTEKAFFFLFLQDMLSRFQAQFHLANDRSKVTLIATMQRERETDSHFLKRSYREIENLSNA